MLGWARWRMPREGRSLDHLFHHGFCTGGAAPPSHALQQVLALSLPVSQQRILNEMDKELCSSDPQLASLFATFTRLTWGEVMPGREELTAGFLGRCRRSARLKTILFFPIALAVMTCAVFIGGGGRGTQKCGPVLSPQRASPVTPSEIFAQVSDITRICAACWGTAGTGQCRSRGLPADGHELCQVAARGRAERRPDGGSAASLPGGLRVTERCRWSPPDTACPSRPGCRWWRPESSVVSSSEPDGWRLEPASRRR